MAYPQREIAGNRALPSPAPTPPFTWISDRHAQYGRRIIPPTVRKATYVLDAIFDNGHDHISFYGRYEFTNPHPATRRPATTPPQALKPLYFFHLIRRRLGIFTPLSVLVLNTHPDMSQFRRTSTSAFSGA